MMRYIVASLVAFSFVALVAVTLSAQQGFGRMGGRGGVQSEGRGNYDPAQAEVVRGQIVAIKDIESKNGKMAGVGAEIQTSSETLLIFFGPHIYVDLQNIRISEGDRVEIVGVRVLLDGRPVFLAGEVKKGDEVLRLRDDKGVPLWSGQRRSGSWN